LMQRPPRDPRTGIFTRPVVLLMLAGGIWSAIVNLSLFVYALNSGRPIAEASICAGWSGRSWWLSPGQR